MIGKSKLKVRSPRALKHTIAMAGFSNKSLAENADITASYVSLIVNGKASPSPTTALKIVSLLSQQLGHNIQVNDIFFDTSVKKSTTLIPKKEAIE